MLQGLRFVSLVAGILAMAAGGPSFAQRAQGYVQEVQGTVTGQVGAGQPRSVSRGQTLPNNATVTTGARSYAVLKFEDGTAVLLKENTSFQVQTYSYSAQAPETSSAVFNLLRGGLRMVTGLVTSRNRDALKVGTPLATIGIRGTEFVAELVNPLYIQVVNGVISVTNGAGAVVFSAGQAAVVANPSTLANIVALNQVPPGVLQVPNFPLTAVPEAVPPGGSPIGGGVAAAGTTTAIAVGVAVGAAAIISGSGGSSSTTTHH